MTHVSKTKVPTNTQKIIDKQFLDMFIAQTTKKEVGRLLASLLSTAETTMLAKRIAIIALLHNNCSSYEISESLKVSSSTVIRIEKLRRSGKFRHLEKILERKKSRKKFLGAIETILNAGMPPISGKGRWSKTFREIDAWKAGG
jgi:Trp operon repressor